MKTLLTHAVVKKWRQQSPPGRFLKKDAKTGTWYDVGTNISRRKTAQLFREGAKEIRKELKNTEGSFDSQDTPFVPTMKEEPFTSDVAKDSDISYQNNDIAATTRSQGEQCLEPSFLVSPTAPDRTDSTLFSDLRDIARTDNNSKTFPYSSPKTSIELLESFFEDIFDDTAIPSEIAKV
jgi:hypothetical protein